MYLIEKFSNQDIGGVLTLQEKCQVSDNLFIPSSQAVFERTFMFKNFCYGIRSSNSIIGFCNCSIPTSKATINLGKMRVTEYELDYVGHVNTILIDPEFRGQKLGTKLLSKSIEEFESLRIKYIYAIINPLNIKSLNLFKSQGFKIIDNILFKGNNRYILQR